MVGPSCSQSSRVAVRFQSVESGTTETTESCEEVVGPLVATENPRGASVSMFQYAIINNVLINNMLCKLSVSMILSIDGISVDSYVPCTLRFSSQTSSEANLANFPS